MTLAAVGILYLTGIAAQIWVETPLDWKVSEEGASVEDLPFPTITICAPDQAYFEAGKERLCQLKVMLAGRPAQCRSCHAGQCQVSVQ